jgi:hypothetical protein
LIEKNKNLPFFIIFFNFSLNSQLSILNIVIISQIFQIEASRMGGLDFTKQIDELLFRGRRKYNRGRLKAG